MPRGGFVTGPISDGAGTHHVIKSGSGADIADDAYFDPVGSGVLLVGMDFPPATTVPIL